MWTYRTGVQLHFKFLLRIVLFIGSEGWQHVLTVQPIYLQIFNLGTSGRRCAMNMASSPPRQRYNVNKFDDVTMLLGDTYQHQGNETVNNKICLAACLQTSFECQCIIYEFISMYLLKTYGGYIRFLGHQKICCL